jgi:hypothetical protein
MDLSYFVDFFFVKILYCSIFNNIKPLFFTHVHYLSSFRYNHKQKYNLMAKSSHHKQLEFGLSASIGCSLAIAAVLSLMYWLYYCKGVCLLLQLVGLYEG